MTYCFIFNDFSNLTTITVRLHLHITPNSTPNLLRCLFSMTCGLSNTYQKLYCKQTQQCIFFFFYNRNFMSDICILTKKKKTQNDEEKKWHKIKRKKNPTRRTALTSTGVDALWTHAGQSVKCVWPHFKKKYTLVHTHAHTPRLNELNDFIQAFLYVTVCME